LAYARERKQGRDALTGEALVTIDHHPDIRRMLMLMKCRVEACRALAYYAAGLLDRVHAATDPDEKKRQLYLAEFMIPIVKGGGTEMGIDVTSLGIQVTAAWASSKKPAPPSTGAIRASPPSTKARPASRPTTCCSAS
jgi:acyl-CoA dehydrogenase